MIIKSYKKTAAALALYAGVTAALLFMGACDGSTEKKVELSSAEDSLAYCMGSMQKLQYMHFIDTSCKVDSNYRAACFDGIEKGYKDTEPNYSYYEGMNIGVQIMSYFAGINSELGSKRFVDGILDGAFEKERINSVKMPDDSVYMTGMKNSKMLKECIKQAEYSDNDIKGFISGFEEGALSFKSPEKYAYVCGKLFGKTLLQKGYTDLNMQVYGNDTARTLSKDLFYAGFFESNSKDAVILHKDVNNISVRLDYEIKNSLYADNKKEGEQFLEDNAKKPGVITLPSGIQYKVLKKGNGKKPSSDSSVLLHYVGKTIHGKVFSDTRNQFEKPYPIKIQDASACYKDVLKLMTEGSICEIYVPFKFAFGTAQTEYFKPFSTVVYELELIKITE